MKFDEYDLATGRYLSDPAIKLGFVIDPQLLACSTELTVAQVRQALLVAVGQKDGRLRRGRLRSFLIKRFGVRPTRFRHSFAL